MNKKNNGFDILFTLNHPAHVHLFKNLINKFKNYGHRIHIVARDKDITLKLLGNLKLEYQVAPINTVPYLHNGLELIHRAILLNKLHKKYKFKYAIGSDTSIAHIMNVKSFVVAEDDDDYTKIFSYITYPFVYKVINPSCLRFEKWKDKRVLHNSYHELAYLHPDNFTPDVKILGSYGLEKYKYIVVRFSALKAFHDTKAKGISGKLWYEIEKVLRGYEVIKSVEGERTHRIEPWDMHHIMAFAKMIISDSQTMTIEGAVLGIPSIRINTFVGKSSVIDELERKYKLAIGILPDKEDDILRTIQSILDNPETDKIWAERRAQLLREKVDFNQWLIDFFENLEEVKNSEN